MPAQLTVYYDGACPLCSREINAYRRRQGADRIQWQDITASDFDAAAVGLNAAALRARFHARLRNGQVVTGVDAFLAIWRELPGLEWLARIASLPVLRQLLDMGYFCFAKLRPYLPRRKDCGNNACEY